MSQRSRLHRLTPLFIALIVVLTPLLAVVRPQPAAAASVVTQCTEAGLRAALEGGGTVTFSGCGTIPIASQLEITEDTAIDGGGAVTLDGQDATRLITVASGVALELYGLTLTGGNAFAESGGAIRNDGGTLTIVASTLSGNNADFGGAIFTSPGNLTLTASTLTGNSAQSSGGAVYNNGTLTLTTSTLEGNSAPGGGAIVNGGSFTLTASTLTGNSASVQGGAILNVGDLTIGASTLTGNSAQFGGAILNTLTGVVTLTASTMAGNVASLNGGTVYNNAGGPVTLTANILSGSSTCAGAAIISNGYNLSSDASCPLTGAGDLQNTDPLLGPLQDNGGPTQTMLPQPGSPALDRVPNATCATLSAANDGRDQRGARRPVGGDPCDSGAVELDGTVPAWLLAAFAIPNTLDEGQSATIHAVASGPFNAQLQYTFGCPIDTVGPQVAPQASCAFLTPGTISVPITVSTTGQPASSDNATVTVQVGNLPPIIQDIRVSRSGSRFTLNVVASDPGGGALTYRFSCADGVIGPQASPTATCDYPNQTGQFAVLVEVIDANQVTVSETVVVELPTYLCVGERSGTPRFMGSPGGCVRGEQPLVLTADGSWSFCVGERSGSLRYLFNSNTNCLRGEWKLTLPEQGPITVCVGERSGSMRYVAQANQCNVRGELVYSIAHRVP